MFGPPDFSAAAGAPRRALVSVNPWLAFQVEPLAALDLKVEYQFRLGARVRAFFNAALREVLERRGRRKLEPTWKAYVHENTVESCARLHKLKRNLHLVKQFLGMAQDASRVRTLFDGGQREIDPNCRRRSTARSSTRCSATRDRSPSAGSPSRRSRWRSPPIKASPFLAMAFMLVALPGRGCALVNRTSRIPHDCLDTARLKRWELCYTLARRPRAGRSASSANHRHRDAATGSGGWRASDGRDGLPGRHSRPQFRQRTIWSTCLLLARRAPVLAALAIAEGHNWLLAAVHRGPFFSELRQHFAPVARRYS